MKINFVHIGFHKTASTYFQKKVFPSIENLKILNSGVEQWFFKKFININPHAFNSEQFLKEFKKKLPKDIFDQGYILGLSDENLSGDIYTGLESRELMLRVRKCFKDATILIVIRNQVDYVLSSYSNYVLHGGTKSLKNWIEGPSTRFGQIIEKLHYSFLIFEYIKIFGKNNVKVLTYEELFDQKNGFPSILRSMGLEYIEKKQSKVNKGRSLTGNRFFSMMNFFKMYKIRGVQKIFDIFQDNQKDRLIVKKIMYKYLSSFDEDNKLIENKLRIKLPLKYKNKTY